MLIEIANVTPLVKTSQRDHPALVYPSDSAEPLGHDESVTPF